MSLLDDLATYIAERAAAAWTQRTVITRRCTLVLAARWLEARGHRRWATVTGADLDAYLLAVAGQGRRRSTVNNIASNLRCFGAWLVERGRVLRDPTTSIRAVDLGAEPLPPAPLSEQQVTALFASIPRRHVVDLRDRLLLELLYSCALRRSEAIHLDVADLDLDRRSLLVRDGKGGKSRLLPIFAGTLTAAADYLALRRELLRGPDHGALLLDATGKRLHPTYVWRLLCRMSRRMGFDVHPHLLRHSIAVHLLRGGADIRHIQEFLGHADLDTTKIYLRLVPGHLREDYDKAMPQLLPVEPVS